MAISTYAQKLKNFLLRYKITAAQVAAKANASAKAHGATYKSAIAEVVAAELPVVTGFVTSSPTTTSLGLAWTAVTGATSYVVVRTLDKNFKVGVTQIYSGTGTSLTASALTTKTKYYFKVTAKAANKFDSFAIASGTTA